MRSISTRYNAPARRLAWLPPSAFLLVYSAGAHAEPTPAQALFYDARSLMKEGRYQEACPKLEESLKIDYGIGTEFNLADCNEKLGKLVAARSGFAHVAATAKSLRQAERERLALERARTLEARIPKLAIIVPAAVSARLEVTRDGVVVDSASWGLAIPVDPGTHRITASESGKEPWQVSVEANEGSSLEIAVPRDLRDAVAAQAPVSETPPPPQPVATPVTTSFEDGTTKQTIGWIVGGVGLAGIGVGVGFASDSLRQRNSAKDHCVGDRCDARGVGLRESAIQSGDIATIALTAGAASVIGGVVLILMGRRESNRPNVARISLQAVPRIAADGGGLSIQGALP